jgi:hypothetical protein
MNVEHRLRMFIIHNRGVIVGHQSLLLSPGKAMNCPMAGIVRYASRGCQRIVSCIQGFSQLLEVIYEYSSGHTGTSSGGSPIMVQQRSVGGSALLWGSIFGGLVVVVLDLVDRFLLGGVDRLAPAIQAALRRRHLVAVRTVNPGRIFLVEGIVLLIIVSLFFLAGCLAARRASAIEAGIGAGALAGAIAGVAHVLVEFLVISLTAHPAVAAQIARGLMVALLALVLGIAMGALGGLIGRGPRASAAPPALPLYSPPQAPAPPGFSSEQAPVTPTVQAPGEGTPPTPYHYGPQNDYPTAPLQSPSPF